jgi:small subunit ribosomal protein S9
MRKAHMIPLPKAAQHHVGHIQAYWRDAEGIKQIVGRNVRQTEYRRLITILTQLNRLKRIATLCGNNEIATQIATTVAPYEKPNKSELEALRSTRKKPVPDENGRVYAVGRRKTSSARVWVIKKQPEAYTEASDRGSVPTTECLVNGIPAARYFAQVTERERVFMPFRLTGLLSSYNVFCIVRGGGTTAQSEAISMGISRALQVLEPEVSPILKQCTSPSHPVLIFVLFADFNSF